VRRVRRVLEKILLGEPRQVLRLAVDGDTQLFFLEPMFSV